MKKISLLSTALLSCLLAGCAGSSQSSSSNTIPTISANAAYSKPRTLENFQDYVQFLKGKAAAEGVSLATLNGQNNIRYVEKAVALDRAQAGRIVKRDPNQPPVLNPNGTTNYLNKVLTNNKVNVAQERYWEVQVPLQRASQRYGVQQEYILALWGMESSFGHYQGRYDVLSALATLAFDGRREALFSKEFVNAMKMLDRDHIQRTKMLGSWAGAMGQTQFMPSAFLNYAADGNGDGVKDIWTNQFDAFASIANYLHTVGWDDNLPWGIEVSLTQPLDLALSGIEKHKARSLRDWQAQGVMPLSFSAQDQEKLTALSHTDLWLVRPDKQVGRAFLVSNNFRTILDWNKSNYFAVSIGMFADRIKEGVGL
ncbi:lytic murein transglycosylase [Rodentibacter trehalosifermentans]|uniref:lytic murein transglycosylase n=1 Tax=Rodentibacter trehalosifermentans TaxID=1908263 RepID=UPI000987287D|nr:lytic murein transglycosylase [Rodentibacter trehalosifermentans]OOF48192.1 lytic transglycosylase [Rodentibacter trehalosifermentans]